ncbi:uncharacterized protein LOC107801196 [Nicotiana tabacum]|uniref:Transcription repressor n=2 Tax=Nicotiana TaxID=4085 RepID=A0A1S4ATS3_TOBAC|nr:PREDICTED: transcription repressor OFP8-like [Nicotiana sylvestris]XP_016479965.1 PREDICTED: transcription repressor OFP8-like [Nicotiana tabacum]
MENKFKTRISRMFKSSFGSCKSKNISDAIDNKPVFQPQNCQQHYQLVELFSPKPRPFPSICAPKYPQNFQTQQQRCSPTNSGVRKNFMQTAVSVYCHNSTSETNGRKCPPTSPIYPLSYDSQEKCNFKNMNKYYEKKTKKKKSKKKKMTNSKIKRFEFEEFPNINYKGLFSSDEESEEDDNNTLFSSRSFTNSDSSEYSFRRKTRRRRAAKSGVKGSLAVVKKSSDPYSDFRVSMLEMIMENQIFAAKDLEKLLECFLSLNSQNHHEVIIEVFTEICEALFSSLS